MFPSLKRCKVKLIYCARKCIIEEGFFCDVLGWLQLFQFSFVISYVILCNVLFAYLILSSILEGIWLGFILISSGWT